MPRTHLVHGDPIVTSGERVPEEEEEKERWGEKKLRRVKGLMAIGAISRAAAVLTRKQLHTIPLSRTMERLKELHPVEDTTEYPDPPAFYVLLGTTPVVVRQAIIRRLGRGAAPSVDGWTRELLIPIAEDAALLAKLTTVSVLKEKKRREKEKRKNVLIDKIARRTSTLSRIINNCFD